MTINGEHQDPRLHIPQDTASGLLPPIVARHSTGIPPVLIFLAFILAGILLFFWLNARRVERREVEQGQTTGTVAMEAPPPLVIPNARDETPPLQSGASPLPPSDSRTTMPNQRPLSAIVPPPPPPTPVPVQIQPAIIPASTPPRPVNPSQPALIIDLTGANEAQGQLADNVSATATQLHQPHFIVPQGTIIPAVLETALDSSRPGMSRAIVSRDTYSFDGKKVLIPRGSRLIGEYKGAAAQGQTRALIIWKRIIRPDGATIQIDSPVTDTLGRGGVRGKVDTHFFARYTSAILQSALNVGVNLASRYNNTPIFIGLPGSSSGVSTGNQNPINTESDIFPTISVEQGTEINIFVARDLSFSGVDAAK